MSEAQMHLSIVVIGASGDLSRRKVLPALLPLYCQKLVDGKFHVFGFARRAMTREDFVGSIRGNLHCKYGPCERCEQRLQDFVGHFSYLQGHYDHAEDFVRLRKAIEEQEQGRPGRRLFYLAVPPSVFLDVARSIHQAGLVYPPDSDPWSRVVIEKPFGSDRASSDALGEALGEVFDESQIYRIDHYLGKEVIQNLMVLRFANLVFEPLWRNLYIKNVQISWTEDLGIGDRAGYFDSYGIIRDVMQNHLLQMLALVAMEEPANLKRQVRDEKVKLLKSVAPVTRDDVVLGQYTAGMYRAEHHPGYHEEKNVPTDSVTPTYAAVVLKIHNRRWEGVPFLMYAGKGLNTRETEIRVRFKEVPHEEFCADGTCLPPNELVIRVQPDEAIYLKIVNKVPGLDYRVEETRLDLRYAAKFDGVIPDAYESLLQDVIRGDRSLFIREDELKVSWDIFTPLLKQLDEERVRPDPYPFGTQGPLAAFALAEAHNVKLK